MTEHNHEAMTHTHGIQDDCPRCAEYVKEPTQLDATNLTRIWRGEHHTRSDVLAYDVLYRSVVITQRLAEAVAWRDFVHGVDSIVDFEPHAKPDQYALFEFGGRR